MAADTTLIARVGGWRMLVGVAIAVAAGGQHAVRAQTCTPPPLHTDCSPSPAFSCPTDQLGPFCVGEPAFLAPLGNGINASGGQLTIDQGCDGNPSGAGDLTVPIPAELQNIANSCTSCVIQYRLSPSQEHFYATVSSNSAAVPGCGLDQVRVFFYAIEPGGALTPFTGDQGVCLPGPISDGPVFYDEPGDPIRTAVMVGDQSASAPVLWADLVGRALNLDTFSYASGIQTPRFAPAGNAALLTRINGGNAQEFSVVDLCTSPIGATGSIATVKCRRRGGRPGRRLHRRPVRRGHARRIDHEHSAG